MKKLFLAAALCGSVTLAGCNTTQDSAAVAAQISAVQQTAVRICGFLPTVSTVTSLIGFFTGTSPITDTAFQVATAVCNAVSGTKSMKRRAAGIPTVNGVPIRGRFVR